MLIVKVCLYIALGVLVVWYFYTLSPNKEKTSRPFGKKKIILKIINKYPNITPRATRQLESAVNEMGNHFFENGEINYESIIFLSLALAEWANLCLQGICFLTLLNMKDMFQF